MDNIQPPKALGVDFGDKRLGLAITSLSAKLPEPYLTLIIDNNIFKTLKQIITSENIKNVIVGMPRSLSGQDTDQTSKTKDFIDNLKKEVKIPIIEKDETLTSVKAEEELNSIGQQYKKTDIDALSAVYILEDWLREDYKSNG
ncbi:MAG TPA: Holliday junction resolvase RuvX [Patescibacteria group bacterium]|nr:Holliday junction resolvase RuvX [Patescibacteria group bacterium]